MPAIRRNDRRGPGIVVSPVASEPGAPASPNVFGLDGAAGGVAPHAPTAEENNVPRSTAGKRSDERLQDSFIANSLPDSLYPIGVIFGDAKYEEGCAPSSRCARGMD